MANKNLKAKQGMLLGLDKNKKHYISDGYQHVLLFAPMGRGKGRAIA